MNSVSFISSLPVVALAVPVAMVVACLFGPVRRRIPDWLGWAPVPALAAAILTAGYPPLVLEWAPYRLMIELDAPGAMLLGTAALLWIAAGVYAGGFLQGTPHREKFAVAWLLTLTGSLGIFLAADLSLFLLFYALVSLPAYGLIVHDGTATARRAGAIYLGFALLGEGLLLLAFVLLAAQPHGGTLRIVDVVTAMSVSPSRGVILALLIAGFGMKMALLPLHVWLPLAHAAAPMPASAVLSGAVVKVGLIGLIRFLPLGVALPDWGHALVGVGLTGAFFGVAVGITQANPKSVLAYSSVSQMGFLASLIGMGWSAGDGSVVQVAAFYAAHHVLVKGALFLAIGVADVVGQNRFSSAVLWPAALIALGLAGLPLTGGALAKLAAKGPLGYGMVGTLGAWSAAGTALLMLHFLRCLAAKANPEGKTAASVRLVLPWWGMVVAALTVPWALFPRVGLGTIAEAITPAALGKVLWPLVVGGLLALGLRRWGSRLPEIPNGDVAALGGGISRAAAGIGTELERADQWVRRWPVAGISLVVVAVALSAAMLATR